MLKTQIQQDQITALKSRDTATLGVLRYIVAQIKYKEIEKKEDLSDEEVISVLKKQVKELKEANEGFEKGGRTDLIEENNRQIAVISRYLPAEMSDEDLQKEIDTLIEEKKDLIAQNPKVIIGICMGQLKSKADPSRISAILRSKGLM